MKLYNYKSQVIMEIEANLPIVFCIGLICFFKSTEEGVKDNTNEVVVTCTKKWNFSRNSCNQYFTRIYVSWIVICYLCDIQHSNGQFPFQVANGMSLFILELLYHLLFSSSLPVMLKFWVPKTYVYPKMVPRFYVI